MNCRQGDLAYVFKSNAGNYGRVVTCLELFPAGSFGMHASLGVIWRVDQLMKRVNIFDKTILTPQYAVADSFLRPLRGDLKNDEVDTQINREAETC